MNWRFSSTALEQIHTLIHIVSPSAFETAMSTYLSDEWRKKGLSVYSDILGNLYADYNGGGKKHVAIVAHMDTVMMQVTNILPSGMLKFRSCGANPYLLLGQAVLVQGNDLQYHGVIGYDPISQYEKGLTDEDLWIDIGMDSQDEVERFISIGNPVVYSPRLSCLNSKYLCGTAIDDRIGLFILNQCIDIQNEKKIPVGLPDRDRPED